VEIVDLSHTKFCLCPRGTQVWSPRLVGAIVYGCIPVIIANHYDLPLSRFFDWSTFSVQVDAAALIDNPQLLYDTLTNMPDEELFEKQHQNKKENTHVHLRPAFDPQILPPQVLADEINFPQNALKWFENVFFRYSSYRERRKKHYEHNARSKGFGNDFYGNQNSAL
jgi:hypothetical protein